MYYLYLLYFDEIINRFQNQTWSKVSTPLSIMGDHHYLQALLFDMLSKLTVNGA